MDTQDTHDLLYRMRLVRAFEEAAEQQYFAGKVHGTMHLYIGEEAVAVGAIAATEPHDQVTSTHRGHGHAIAKGQDVRLMMAELLAKETGVCRGRGGSMHMADLSVGILSADGIVGGGVPMAVGAALAAKMKRTDQVAVAFFGDGAINSGQFHEAMNLAALWKLPVLFVCDNNMYAVSMAASESTAGSLSARAAGYGIPGINVDGNDPMAVYEVTQQALARARSGEGPTVIDALTYRWEGHSRNDPGTDYRTKEEIAEWKARDPVLLVRGQLIAMGAQTEESLEAVEQAARAKVDAAIEFAKASPHPKAEDVLKYTYC